MKVKIHVTRICGHEEIVNILGSAAQREGRIKYEEKRLCADCYVRDISGKGAKFVEEKEMLYSEYKQSYSEYKTLPNSYNHKTKTIVVLVPHKKSVSEMTIPEQAEEIKTTATNMAKKELSNALSFEPSMVQPWSSILASLEIFFSKANDEQIIEKKGLLEPSFLKERALEQKSKLEGKDV